VHETVLEDGLRDHARSPRNGHQGHDLGLQVRREPRVGKGLDIDAPDLRHAPHPEAALGRLDGDPRFLQLQDEGLEVFRVAALQDDVAARDGRGDQEGPRLDPVGDDADLAGFEALDALDGDHVGAGALNPRPHGLERIGEVDDLGLLGGVLQPGGPLREGRRHHDVLRAPHGGDVEVDPGPPEAPGPGLHVAFPQIDLGPHGLEGLEVEVDRAGADGAAAGERHPCLAHPRHQRPEDEDGGPHSPHQVVGRLAAGDVAAVDPQGVALAFHLRPVVGQEFLDRPDIGKVGDVSVGAPAVGQKGRHENGQGGVFRAADPHAPFQLVPAFDDKLVQSVYSC